jgi:DNA-binding response OmpR family regulator
MNHKVLLADDSLTIQKVIRITLANRPYDMIDCSSEEELFKKVPEIKPDLVFLDFNLSEKYSGYELTSKIKSLSPDTKVLLLLGTFDTVDDAAMEKCGASDKVVKPFDSNKFISICNRLMDSGPVEDKINFPKPISEVASPSVDSSDDQWSVNHTVEQSTPSVQKEKLDVRQLLNPLDQEVNDWGMSIPEVINSKDAAEDEMQLPPVIENIAYLDGHRAKNQETMAAQEEIKFPASDDLDYPTIEEMQSTAAKLISIETFNQDPIEFQIEHTINSNDETDISNLEAQIRDEVEQDLWKADEFQNLKNEVSAKIEEVKENFKPSVKDFDASLFGPIDELSFESQPTESLKNNSPAFDPSELKVEIELLVKKYVKEYMDEMFKQNVEKVTWEVIPDLAENLIRQELSKISNKVLNE